MFGDPETYRSKSEVAEWRSRDPLKVLGERLKERGVTVRTMLNHDL
jgi:TPP-dependent pyruvate/acetoin dehydrogenase alpha subunit